MAAGALSARWRAVVALAIAAAAAVVATPSAARSVALLVGVSDYGGGGRDLEGPAHDVEAMRDVLVRRWGLAPQDVQTLVNARATRAGILEHLRLLEQRSRSGDDVLIYFSGHGTSALDSVARLPVPHGSGAFVPSGIDTSTPERTAATLLVGRTDLRPAIERLERGGRRLWVVSDSCYSGNQVRSAFAGAGDALAARVMPLDDPRGERQKLADWALARQRPADEPYPYQSTVYLAASGEGEVARDIRQRNLAAFPTVDGRPHGALTDALLRVLEGRLPADVNRDGRLDLNEVHRAVTDFMTRRGYGHTPQRLPTVAEDRAGLGARILLPDAGVGVGVAAAPADVDGGPAPLVVRWLGDDAAARERLIGDVQGIRLSDQDAPELVIASRAGHWVLLTPGGDEIGRVEASQPERLREQMRQLALVRRLRLLAERHRRAVLPFEISPANLNGRFRLGEALHFSVRPDRPARLVVANIAADGRLTVLYPATRDELAPLPADRFHAIPSAEPGKRIVAGLPLGMDTQLAFAFDDASAADLEPLVNLRQVDADDARVQAFARMLARLSGRFDAAQSWLRTVDVPR